MWRCGAWLIVLAILPLLIPACGGDEAGNASNFNPGGACTTQAQCATGAYCKAGECASCGCSKGQTCDAQGVCSATVGCTPACGSGEVCSAAGTCIAQGSCKNDQDCLLSAGLKCSVSEGKCVPGGECGEKEFTISAQTPNMLIALDRTGSMGAQVPNTGGKSRWQVAKEAVAQLLAAHGTKINFGLSLFSACTGNGCAPGIINEPLGATENAINQAVSAAQLCNSGDNETVIGGTLNAMIAEASLQAADRQNYILLITDGQDNCGGGGAAAATALLAQTVPVKTFVVGFSGDVDTAELTAIATAATTAPYYQADDAKQLNQALSTIASGVATCTYKLDTVPPSPGLFVFFNKDPAGVSKDSANGWTYDSASNTLTFHGTACNDVKSGKVTDIDVIFSCSQPLPR